MEENQRSHVIEEIGLALGHLGEAIDRLGDDPTMADALGRIWHLRSMLRWHYADLSEALESLRKEEPTDK